MRVEILASKEASTVEMTIHEPLPRVPTWIRLQTHGDRPHFWTLPSGHFLERTEARYGYPRDIVATSRRFLAGEVDQATAETQLCTALTNWSQSTR